MTAWYVILSLSIATFATGMGPAAPLLDSVQADAHGHRHCGALDEARTISQLAANASGRGVSVDGMVGLRTSLLLHAIGGLSVLVRALILAVYKPAGLMRFADRAAPTPDG